MAIVQAICTSFKQELLEAGHDFSSDTFKIALYTSAANIGPSTTVYTTDGELAEGDYSRGGEDLVVTAPATSGTTAFVDFDDIVITVATTDSARGALIYNDTAALDEAVAVLNFGIDITGQATVSIEFPAGDFENAIIRVD